MEGVFTYIRYFACPVLDQIIQKIKGGSGCLDLGFFFVRHA